MNPRAWILFAALVLHAPTTQADTTAEARKLLAAGISHYTNGEFSQAISELKKVAALNPAPAVAARIHAYLGANYFVTNRREKAQEAFAEALKHDPAIKVEVKEVGASILRLFEATRKGYRGTLREDRPGLVVFVDGQRVGKSPWQQRLVVGAHKVGLETADGRKRCQQRVVVGVDATVKVTCKLAPVTGTLFLVSTPPGATSSLIKGRALGKTPVKGVSLPVGRYRIRLRLEDHHEQVVIVTVARDRATVRRVRLKKLPETRASRRSFRTVLAYSSLGLGASLLAGAAVLYGLGASEGGDAYDDYREADSGKEYESTRMRIESAREKLIMGHVLSGVAMAAVGFSVYLLVTRQEAPRKRALTISPTTGGAVLRVSF